MVSRPYEGAPCGTRSRARRTRFGSCSARSCISRSSSSRRGSQPGWASWCSSCSPSLPSRCCAETVELPEASRAQRAAVEDTRRILVVANETLEGARLHGEIVRMADGVAEDVLVVCPALNSQFRTWLSDEDGARDAASRRLAATLNLTAGGIKASGQIGDGDPLRLSRMRYVTSMRMRSSSRHIPKVSRTGSSAVSWIPHARGSASRSCT